MTTEDITLILLAILLSYALENIKKLGDYSCPAYCEVNHEHEIKENQYDWNDGSQNAKRKEKKHLHGIKRDDKHSTSEREERTSLHRVCF